MAGIAVRGQQRKIYVNFYFNGKRYNEVTPYTCEKQGVSGCKCRGCFAATAYGMEIEQKILDGTFDLFTAISQYSFYVVFTIFSILFAVRNDQGESNNEIYSLGVRSIAQRATP